MPELPEVETVARGLAATLLGAQIVGLAHLRAGIFHPGNAVARAQWGERLSGLRFIGFRRRAKWLVAELGPGAAPRIAGGVSKVATPGPAVPSGPHLTTGVARGSPSTPVTLWWILHLRMTGRVLVVDPSIPRPNHTHLELAIRGGPDESATCGGTDRLVRFVDPRRFGRTLLVNTDPFSAAGAGVLGELGPEPLELSAAEFVTRARASSTRLKALLLDQTFLAGLGNIYVDESLFVAGLPPTARANAVSPARLADLHAAIQAVLTKAIKLGGTSMRDYIHPDGSYGAYHEQFLAYGRGGEPCFLCKTPLTETRLGQRATVFCMRCQKTRAGRGLALDALKPR